MTGIVAARLARDSEIRDAYNAIDTQSVFVYMQKCAGVPERENRGIEGLDYRILCDGTLIRQGRTAADGKIEIRLPVGRRVILEVLSSQYEISIMPTLHPIDQIRGVQQRLEMLGYHIGPIHGDGRLASTYRNPDSITEYAMLEFQTDANLFADAKFGTQSGRKLQEHITDAGGE
jgi:hypothetical protein